MSRPSLLMAFFEEKEGTVYVLSDPNVKLRDSWSLINLVRFFTGHRVKLNIRVVLSNTSLSGDIHELKALQNEEFVGQEVDLDSLFKRLNEKRRQKIDGSAIDVPPLYPTGPILLLGRPSFYPNQFRNEIETEFEITTRFKPRFEVECDDPFKDAFRTVRDWYTDLKYQPQSSTDDRSPDTQTRNRGKDWAIIRIVKSPLFRSRQLIYAYGTGSVGTLGAVYSLIDPSLSESLVERGNLQVILEKYGYAEVLLRILKESHFDFPWAGELRPRDIKLEASAVAPVHENRAKLVDLFLEKSNNTEQFAEQGLPYKVTEFGQGHKTFEVKDLFPQHDEDDPFILQMVGGKRICDFVEELHRMLEQEPKAILIIGTTGVGKELAARIIYQQRVITILKKLAERKCDNKSVVIGPYFVALNLTAMPETLIERDLFGIGDKMADVRGNRGALLNAGEGVVLLDEIESMPMTWQPKLLRALDIPYEVTPIGVSKRLQTSAIYVVCCNEEPDELVAKGRLRADLYGRLKKFAIRIPPLDERIADIPALLTFFAEKKVRLNKRALRALFMRDYPYNVRDLFRFTRPSSTSHHTEQDFIDIEIEDIYDGYHRPQEASSKSDAKHDNEEAFYCEFAFDPGKKPYGSKLFNIFERAAIILSSLEVKKVSKGKFSLAERLSTVDCSDIWSTLEKEKPAVHELLKEWVQIVAAITGYEEDIKDFALRTLGKMFRLRFKETGVYGEACREFRARFDTHMDIKDNVASVSLGLADPQAYSRYREKTKMRKDRGE